MTGGSRKSLFKGLIASIFLVLVIVGLTQQQALTDWWMLRNYEPSGAINALANDTAMTEKAKRLFFVYHPKIEGRDTFRQDCANFEYSIVLGCYKSKIGIYIFDVEDDRLSGVEEVTAAHEMLHVAYERLSKNERNRLNKMLQQQESLITDARVQQTLKSYREDPEVDINNEMHSIFGTEVEMLTPELEEYYRNYFMNRKIVVAFSKKYESEFIKRENKIVEIDNELESKKIAFEKLKSKIDQEAAKLEVMQVEMQTLKVTNTEQFNIRLPSYNASVKSYNAMIDEAKSLIEQYNRLIEERNTIALERKSLLQSLDSRSTSL